MRIVVAGQPKTGNVWVKHLLAEMYRLTILDATPAAHPEAIRAFVAAGRFPADSIYHEHIWPSVDLFEAFPKDCRVVTPLRNPYDTFVSFYHFVQRRKQAYEETGDPAAAMIDRRIDDPDVLDYLRVHYGHPLSLAVLWMRSGHTTPIRYEDLWRHPIETLERAMESLGRVSRGAIEHAVRVASAETQLAKGGYWQVHIRTGRVGDWRKYLIDAHLQIFRDVHADAIRSLGYTVVEPPESADQ